MSSDAVDTSLMVIAEESADSPKNNKAVLAQHVDELEATSGHASSELVLRLQGNLKAAFAKVKGLVQAQVGELVWTPNLAMDVSWNVLSFPRSSRRIRTEWGQMTGSDGESPKVLMELSRSSPVRIAYYDEQDRRVEVERTVIRGILYLEASAGVGDLMVIRYIERSTSPDYNDSKLRVHRRHIVQLYGRHIVQLYGSTQQNDSVDSFITVSTIATFYTAEDCAVVSIDNFDDLIDEFQDLDITDSIQSVSPLVGGIGGTASVKQASYGNQLVAMKMVEATYASVKTVKRLAREIAVWRTLSHPNILPLYGLYYHDEKRVPAMVSPWCTNGNIVEFLSARSHLPAVDMMRLRLRLLLDALEGLACLHHEHIVHGDLKGANILVSENGTACVADFGVSTVLRDHPQSASAAGTFRWMAPELLVDDNPQRTRESDMWAYGCVMVEVISGKPPFHAIKNEPAVIIALFGGATPQRPPQASDMMWECCQECFRQKPEDRLTADILLLRLRALVEGTPEGSAVALPPQEEQAPATSTSYEGYSV